MPRTTWIAWTGPVLLLALLIACGGGEPSAPAAETSEAGTTAEPSPTTDDGTGTVVDGGADTGSAPDAEGDPATTPAADQTSAPATSAADASADSSTTTAAPTTTVYSGPVSPLTGLPVDNPALLDRRLVAVKMDNHWNARPQSGVEQADAVYELVVESGLTRFVALFHHTDSDWVGPMRSARPTDWTLVKSLNGVLAISGGQRWITSRISANGVPMIGDSGPPVTARWSERKAPHNLYVNTYEVRRVADERGIDRQPPPTLFDRGPFSAPAEAQASYMFFDWSDTVDVTWRWDGERYVRSVEGESHTWRSREGDATGQISADVLVVLFAKRYTACPTGDGSCVPAWDTVGENRAIVFAEARYQEGRWRRADAGDWFEVTDPAGGGITIPPGRMWIMIYPETADLIW